MDILKSNKGIVHERSYYGSLETDAVGKMP